MITEGLLNMLFGFAEGLLEKFPDITWSVDTTAWEYVKDILDMIAYLLPMAHIKMIVSAIVALTCVRIFISVGKTIFNFIPFV